MDFSESMMRNVNIRLNLKICLRSKYSIDPCSDDDHLVRFRGAWRSHDKREKEGRFVGRCVEASLGWKLERVTMYGCGWSSPSQRNNGKT